MDQLPEDWVPERALEALRGETQVHDNEDSPELAQRLFKENAPMAALGIVHLATYCKNERIRFDAQKYVIDRTIGPVNASNTVQDSDQLLDLVKELTDNA